MLCITDVARDCGACDAVMSMTARTGVTVYATAQSKQELRCTSTNLTRSMIVHTQNTSQVMHSHDTGTAPHTVNRRALRIQYDAVCCAQPNVQIVPVVINAAHTSKGLQ
jgi:hypothetical protein